MMENLETFEVEEPKEAMEKFKSALAQVVRVPKVVVERKRKRTTAKLKKKRNAQPLRPSVRP